MKINKLGFFQALGVAGYCSLIGLILWQGSNIFPKVNPYFGPVMFLLLFSTSALICGLLVFYKPYKLFLTDRRKEAVDTVISTAAWLFVFLAIFFVLVAIPR